jgi:alanine dehydrogenase
MRIGIPKEIKPQEGRVAFLPRHVAVLAGKAHGVLVEQGAGIISGAPDVAYLQCGARIVASASEVFGAAEMVVKVKEILPEEYPPVAAGAHLVQQ